MEDNKKENPFANTIEAIAKREERAKKKAQKEAEEAARKAELEKQLAEEQRNLLFQPLSETQEERSDKKKKLNAKYHYLRGKRKEYLENRNLAKAELEESEVLEFRNVLRLFISYQQEIGRILIEMLKYPNNELNTYADEALDTLLKEDKVSMSFWVDILSREFLPNDILRLMKKHQKMLKEQGGNYIFPRELKRHLEAEMQRLEQAGNIENQEKREMQFMRVNNRIVEFETLLMTFKKP